MTRVERIAATLGEWGIADSLEEDELRELVDALAAA